MRRREAVSAISILGAGELLLARATSGPLAPADVGVTLLGWLAVLLLVWRRWPGPRAIVEVATLVIALHVALPPALAAGGPIVAAILALMLAAALVGSRDLPATTLTPFAIGVATLLATLAGPPAPPARILDALLGVAAAWLIATRVHPGFVLPLAGLIAVFGVSRFPTRDPRPDVVVVTVDALRADVGSDLASFRRVAAKGRAYEAWAPAPWTLPSLAGLQTGVPAHRNGAGRARGGGFAPLLPTLPTLAERLRAAGWSTVAISGGNPFTGQRYGLLRGFRETSHPWEPVGAPLPRMRAPYARARPLFARVLRPTPPPVPDGAEALVDRAIDRLSQLDRPRFLWLHLVDVHLPYADPPCRPDVLARPDARTALLDDPWWSTPDGLACLSTAYRKAAADVDAALVRLLDHLDLDRTIVVLTSDHGEALGEVGFEHGHTLQPEVERIPLAIAAPYRVLPSTTGPASLTDVGATILSLLGLPPDLPGIDLTSGRPLGPTALSNMLYGPPRRGAVDGDWEMIETRDDRHVLGWRRPIAQREEPPRPNAKIVDRLGRWLPVEQSAGEAVGGDEERLRAVGYVE